MIRIHLRNAMEKYSDIHSKITYQELAKKTGLSKATLEALGSRPSYNTTLATIDTLCHALECDLSDLLTFEK
ncbi:MAG: XRE family transcriptional regulator [Candidatus Electrothrix sp. AX5]|nr:XRE family transcriptional regulator [Candidatus Electrothrix sp. AX5]